MARVDDEDTTTTGVEQGLLIAMKGLEDLAQAASQATGSTEGWATAASRAETIANGLKTEDVRLALGGTSLIDSCGTLLRLSVLAGVEAIQARTQVLRVIGNMCFDNNENRARTQAAAIPATIIELLRRILRIESTESGDDQTEFDAPKSTWSLDELLFMRAATGALLNMSLSYDPIRDELNNPDSLAVVLSLLDARAERPRPSPPVYTINTWLTVDSEDEEQQAGLDASSTTATWAMNVLTNVVGDKKASFPPQGVSILASIILSLRSGSTSRTAIPFKRESEDAAEYVENDISLLTEAAGLLEAVAMDVESVKEELGAGQLSESEGRILPRLMDFVESGEPPEYWLSCVEDSSELQKNFALVKSAVVRAIVEVPNSDKMMNSLFAYGHKSWLVVRLVDWMEKASENREDLLICASHMLAALARKDEHCISLVQQYGVATPLARITIDKCALQLQGPKTGTRPGETTQILYGVISLLRHLSIPLINKLVLGDTGIVAPVSNLLRSELDVVGPLQNAAVGLLKHLAAANVPNSLRLLETDAKLDFEVIEKDAETTSQEPEQQATNDRDTPVDRILALIARTDDVRLRSEATRVLVNVVRSLFATKSLGTAELAAASPITPTLHSSSQSGLDAEEVMKRRGRPKVARKEVAIALSEMVRLSERYPMLINEAIVGLTLLAGSGGAGAIFVLDALIERHPKSEDRDAPAPAPVSEIAPSPSSRSGSLALTSAGDPPTSADMLTNWLGLCASSQLDRSSTSTSSGVRPEMIGNAAALLITVLRGADVARADKTKVDALRVKVLAPLRGCVEAMAQEQNEVLKRTVARCLEVVAA